MTPIAAKLSVAFLVVSAMAVPVFAQQGTEPAEIVIGTQVKDTQGGVVGTVTVAGPDFLTVKTDRHEVRLPRVSFTPASGALLFAMTQQQLNEAVDRDLAAAAAQLVPGALVKGSQGAVVGTIDAIDDQFVTLKLASGKMVRLPRGGVGAGPQGVVIGMTVAELEAQVAEAPENP